MTYILNIYIIKSIMYMFKIYIPPRPAGQFNFACPWFLCVLSWVSSFLFAFFLFLPQLPTTALSGPPFTPPKVRTWQVYTCRKTRYICQVASKTGISLGWLLRQVRVSGARSGTIQECDLKSSAVWPSGSPRNPGSAVGKPSPNYYWAAVQYCSYTESTPLIS